MRCYRPARGKGGISIVRYQGHKSLMDFLLDLLPDPPETGQIPSRKN